MLLTQQLHRIPSWEITTIGAVIMVASGILKPKDAYQAMGLGGMVLLYAGMLALGSALTATGAGNLVGNLLASVVGSTRNNYVIGLLFFITPFLLTQFMMNVAVINIFIPIAIVTSKSLACNPLGLIMLVWIARLDGLCNPDGDADRLHGDGPRRI